MIFVPQKSRKTQKGLINENENDNDNENENEKTWLTTKLNIAI